VKTRTIAPGVELTKIAQKKIPRRTFILRLDPSAKATLDVTLAENRLPASARVSEIARRVNAIAAVNGDFGSHVRPTHVFAQDGDLVQSSAEGALFAMRADEQAVYLGTPQIDVVVTNTDSGQAWEIRDLNRSQPALGDVVAYTPVGGTLASPPPFMCSVRMLPDGAPTSVSGGVVRDYTVDTARCSEKPMAREDGVLLTAPPATDEATVLLGLQPGTPMELRWTSGWDDVRDIVGGIPMLIRDGKIVVQSCSSSFCRRNPRTAIGWTASGDILLVVIDGRQHRWSVGASLLELARVLRDHGAVQALNLDGGGSTTMVVRGDVINRPSDGHERRITNAVVILPGADPGEG
jgi:exopolysaccharide biosynthesis protein